MNFNNCLLTLNLQAKFSLLPEIKVNPTIIVKDKDPLIKNCLPYFPQTLAIVYVVIRGPVGNVFSLFHIVASHGAFV